MGDVNTLSLVGRLIKPEIRSVSAGKHHFFKFKVDTGNGFPIGVSIYAKRGAKQDDVVRFGLDKIIEAYEARQPMTVQILDAFIDGNNDSGQWTFWDASGRFSKLKFIEGLKEPATPVNQSMVTGTVVEIESVSDTHTLFILASSYYSKSTDDPADRGGIKKRHIRVRVPNQMIEATTGQLLPGQEVLCAGPCLSKVGDDWLLHISAQQFVPVPMAVQPLAE